ncbi:MAG: M48 family metalloprotease [Bacteroidota bacterium]
MIVIETANKTKLSRKNLSVFRSILERRSFWKNYFINQWNILMPCKERSQYALFGQKINIILVADSRSMKSISSLYPASPSNVNKSIIEPSEAFKREVFKTLGAILLFIIAYIALFVTAIGLAVLCGLGGVALVTAFPHFITLMLGIGLIGLGVMVIYFLLKVVGSTNTVDRSDLVEITEADQPELIAFIRRLTEEMQAPFPKRIYLSTDVNASVFYDSSFWSMFFPIRKNLRIGLGLVNAINMSELKAVLAHEFGHFSQRSMKMGSYVYNVNHVVHNMLYDNHGYGATLERWGNMSGYFSIFASLTVWIVKGIQRVLQRVYVLVNKTYLGLSRQMEFHADSVAAFVSGSSHLITSLRRLEVADLCYNRLLQYYNMWLAQELKPDNLFAQHSEVMKHFADDFNLNFENGLPVVTEKSFAHLNHTRIVVKEQWASHPSTEDREAHLNSLNAKADTLTLPAWSIFRDVETLQQQMTQKLYETVTFKEEPKKLDLSTFRLRYYEDVEKFKLDKAYRGVFDTRNVTTFDPTQVAQEISATNIETLNDLLTDNMAMTPQLISGLQTDLNVLEMIGNGTLQVKTFEFEGLKFGKNNLTEIQDRLKEELKQAEDRLASLDKQLFVFFLTKAKKQNKEEELIRWYQHLFAATEETAADIKRYTDMMWEVNPIYGQMEIAAAELVAANIKRREIEIKERLKTMLGDETYLDLIEVSDRETLNEYLAKDHVYFVKPDFMNEALKLFNEAMVIYHNTAYQRTFTLKKKLLEQQLQFLS